VALRRSARGSQLDNFQNYVHQRWNEGCRNAAQFFHELRPRCFIGRYTIVRDYVASLRAVAGVPVRSRRAVGQAFRGDVSKKRLTTRSLAWKATQLPDSRDPDSQRFLDHLGQSNPTLKTAVEIAQSFAGMVRQRKPDKLETWLVDAAATGLKALRSFMKGSRADYGAVYAALKLPWSNEHAEGTVYRFICIKR
jgi:transposase